MRYLLDQDAARSWVEKNGQPFITSLAAGGWAVDQVAVGQGVERAAWGSVLHLHTE